MGDIEEFLAKETVLINDHKKDALVSEGATNDNKMIRTSSLCATRAEDRGGTSHKSGAPHLQSFPSIRGQ